MTIKFTTLYSFWRSGIQFQLRWEVLAWGISWYFGQDAGWASHFQGDFIPWLASWHCLLTGGLSCPSWGPFSTSYWSVLRRRSLPPATPTPQSKKSRRASWKWQCLLWAHLRNFTALLCYILLEMSHCFWPILKGSESHLTFWKEECERISTYILKPPQRASFQSPL